MYVCIIVFIGVNGILKKFLEWRLGLWDRDEVRPTLGNDSNHSPYLDRADSRQRVDGSWLHYVALFFARCTRYIIYFILYETVSSMCVYSRAYNVYGFYTV